MIANKSSEIRDIITSCVDACISYCEYECEKKICSTVVGDLVDFIKSSLTIDIKQSLEYNIISIDPLISHIGFNIHSNSKLGACYKKTILLDLSLANAISDLIVQSIADGLIHQKPRFDFLTKDQLTNLFTRYKSEPYLPQLNEYIQDIVELVVHELVHVHQHCSQINDDFDELDDYNWEYRSYLTKDIDKFKDVMKRKQSDLDWTLYFSSPQEISAFAAQYASHIMSSNSKWNVNYRIFKEYKSRFTGRNLFIFKRFMKKTYKELVLK